MASTVRVTQIKENWDMRSTHPMRALGKRGLKPGEVSLFLNKRRTIAKLVDCEGGLYQHWCEATERFDLELIRQRVAILGLELTVNGTQAQRKAKRLQAAA